MSRYKLNKLFSILNENMWKIGNCVPPKKQRIHEKKNVSDLFNTENGSFNRQTVTIVPE